MSSPVSRSQETAVVAVQPQAAPAKKPLSPAMQCAIGAMVGGGEPVFGTLFNNVKQALQNGAPIPRSARALWSGTMLNSLYCASVTAPQFFVRGVLRQHFSEDGKRRLEMRHHLLTAFFSSLASSFIATPSEMVMANFAEKMRRYEMAKKQKIVCPKPTYATTVAAIRAKYGLGGFYRGWIGIVMRDKKFVFCYSTLAPALAQMFAMHFPQSPVATNLGGGVVAGSFAAVISHHWDTWKTRRALGVETTFMQFLLQGHRGLAPRMVRIGLAVGTYTVGTDELTELFQKMKI